MGTCITYSTYLTDNRYLHYLQHVPDRQWVPTVHTWQTMGTYITYSTYLTDNRYLHYLQYIPDRQWVPTLPTVHTWQTIGTYITYSMYLTDNRYLHYLQHVPVTAFLTYDVVLRPNTLNQFLYTITGVLCSDYPQIDNTTTSTDFTYRVSERSRCTYDDQRRGFCRYYSNYYYKNVQKPKSVWAIIDILPIPAKYHVP